MSCKARKDAQRRAKTRKAAQRRANRKFWNLFWKFAKLTGEVAGARVGYQKTHKIQTLKPYISLFKILLILRKLRKLRNDKVNSFLLFGNRTKIDEKSPLFGGPYRNSHQQFFYSPFTPSSTHSRESSKSDPANFGTITRHTFALHAARKMKKCDHFGGSSTPFPPRINVGSCDYDRIYASVST